MLEIKDIYWAAGFIEGEGCFQRWGWNQTITVSQVQREPLERLHRMFGGKIHCFEQNDRSRRMTYYRWIVTNATARGLMMTLYCLMSPKRKVEIAKALAFWRSRGQRPQYRTKCPRGHVYDEHNTMINSSTGGRYCRECANGLRSGKYEREVIH